MCIRDRCELELSIFKPKLRSRVHLRSNLIDTGIAICSPSVPTTFSDASNLDLATINGFVKRMLDDAAISGEEVIHSVTGTFQKCIILGLFPFDRRQRIRNQCFKF